MKELNSEPVVNCNCTDSEYTQYAIQIFKYAQGSKCRINYLIGKAWNTLKDDKHGTKISILTTAIGQEAARKSYAMYRNYGYIVGKIPESEWDFTKSWEHHRNKVCNRSMFSKGQIAVTDENCNRTVTVLSLFNTHNKPSLYSGIAFDTGRIIVQHQCEHCHVKSVLTAPKSSTMIEYAAAWVKQETTSIDNERDEFAEEE